MNVPEAEYFNKLATANYRNKAQVIPNGLTLLSGHENGHTKNSMPENMG